MLVDDLWGKAYLFGSKTFLQYPSDHRRFIQLKKQR